MVIPESIPLLLVEDNPADAHLLHQFLTATPGDVFDLTYVEQLSEAKAKIQQVNFAVILLDLSLPDSQGMESIKQIQLVAPEIPIVVLTGLDDEEIATEALREGAQDYLVKGTIQRDGLVRAIHYAIERQQILERLQHLNEALKRSNREFEQFASVVSHDLQQPLMAIKSFAWLLAQQYQGSLDKKADSYIAHIVSGTTRMQQLIADILSYARLDQQPEGSKPVDTSQVLKLVLMNLDAMIQESGALITHDDLPTIHGDEGQISQLLQNLIGNALKYRRATVPPRIKVSVQKAGNTWRFGVGDNGIGLESQYSQRIFKIFQRLHSEQEYPGTGIGLAICQKIVERHGGKIWVESEPEVGSTFYFTLPQAEHDNTTH